MYYFYINRYYQYLFTALITIFFSPVLQAADLDTQLRINQNIERQSNRQIQQLLKDEDYQQQHPKLVIAGKPYAVQHNASDLGRALYTSIKDKKWSAVQYFLDQYQSLNNPDPMLLAYAKGALARIKGEMQESIKQYRHLLTLNPNFLPGQLELARVLFEDHQDKEARGIFTKIAKYLDTDDTQHAGVNRSVQSFSKALEQRSDWSLFFAIGSVWKDNLNQSSENQSCLLTYQGQCVYQRSIPKAISTRGLDYEFTASKALPIAKHHALYSQSILYGKKYDDHPGYDQSTFNTQLGYRFQNFTDQLRLAPSFEYSTYADKSLFSAWGLHGDWTHKISNQRMFKVSADYKELRYKKSNFQRYDGPSYSTNITAWQGLNNNWVVFAGADWLNRLAQDRPYAYRQIGVRLGVSKTFNNTVSATLSGSVRQQTYHKFSNILGERRKDREKNLTLSLKSARWSLFGFKPHLTLKHTDVSSNVDWLYSRRSNEISLKLERSF